MSCRGLEQLRLNVDALLDQAAGKLRHVAGGIEVAAGNAAIIDARLLKAEQILNRIVAAFQGRDFRNPHDAANAALETGQMNDERDRRGDVPPHDGDRQVEARHADHHFQTGQGVARVVGVDRRQRAFVARVHGLQHVERFAAADFAEDDAVGPHAKGVAHQVALRDFAGAFDVWRPRFELDDVLPLQQQFGRVFDRHQPLVGRDEVREGIEQRRFAAAGAAARS